MTDISVILATANRSSELATTLESIARCTFPPDRLEVVVVDNADDPGTAEVCRRHAEHSRLTLLVHPEGGKNAALNHAVERAEGSLFVFTDDDVTASPDWLSALWAATSRWPSQHVFGGRILPVWPSKPPAYVLESKYLQMLFAVLDPPLDEGPQAGFMPFGPNLAVRRAIFDGGARYNATIGPGTGSMYAMGSETEFIRRLRDSGHVPVYVPSALVHHRIREQQLGLLALLRRGVRCGKTQVWKDMPAGTYWGRVPRWLFREAGEHSAVSLFALARGNFGRAFDRAMGAAITWGQIRSFREATERHGAAGRP